MKNTPDYFSWFILFSCISLFGLVSYRLINTKLTDEEKKKISYGEIVISLFVSIQILLFMIMLAIGISFSFLRFFIFRGFVSYYDSFLRFIHILQIFLPMFIWAIFCIITSPISLTTIQYVFQDNLGNSDKFLSIGILLSTIFSFVFRKFEWNFTVFF
jgi:hypothetical protein